MTRTSKTRRTKTRLTTKRKRSRRLKTSRRTTARRRTMRRRSRRRTSRRVQQKGRQQEVVTKNTKEDKKTTARRRTKGEGRSRMVTNKRTTNWRIRVRQGVVQPGGLQKKNCWPYRENNSIEDGSKENEIFWQYFPMLARFLNNFCLFVLFLFYF